MEHFVAKDAILASFARQVYQATGAIHFEVPVIVVRADIPDVRIIDASGGIQQVARWVLTDAADIPDAIRLLQQKDPYICRCVLLDTGEEFVLVDWRTLKPFSLFGSQRRIRYAA